MMPMKLALFITLFSGGLDFRVSCNHMVPLIIKAVKLYLYWYPKKLYVFNIYTHTDIYILYCNVLLSCPFVTKCRKSIVMVFMTVQNMDTWNVATSGNSFVSFFSSFCHSTAATYHQHMRETLEDKVKTLRSWSTEEGGDIMEHKTR